MQSEPLKDIRFPHVLPAMPRSREARIRWMGSLKVGEIMTSPATCVDPYTSVSAAQLLMREHRIRRLPVVEDERLVGIITLGDTRGALPSEVTTLNRGELDYLMDQLKVERVMTRQIVTVSPTAGLKEAARLMVEHRIGGLPVVSAQGRVIGVITESDVFRTLVELLDLDETESAPSLAQPAPIGK